MTADGTVGGDELPEVLVDARNVLRSTWPNMAEEEAVAACGRFAAEAGVRVTVVFDGRAPGGAVGEEPLDDDTIVVGTGGESADDWIARRARELRDEGRRHWLVTSDRELRARAGGGAERQIGGGAFARTLLQR